MAVADLHGSQPEVVFASIKQSAVLVTKFHCHSIKDRVGEIPKRRVRYREVKPGCGIAWSSLSFGHFRPAHDFPPGRVEGCDYLKGILALRNISEEHRGRDLSFIRRNRTGDALTSDQSLVVDREPYIAHQTAIVPPVVPNPMTFPQAQRKSRYALRGWSIVEFDSEKVIARTQGGGNVEPVRGVASFMRSQQLAIQPNPAPVRGSCEMQLNMLSGKGRA